MRKRERDGKGPRNLPMNKTLPVINFYVLLCAKDSERFQHNSCAALLSFQGQSMDTVGNKLAAGTQGGQKLVRKSSGSLHKRMIKSKGWGEGNAVFVGFLKQHLPIPSDTRGSSPS